MQDFLQINTEFYDWQKITIDKIKKEIFGERRTSFDISSYNKRDTKLVVVYGPPQIGKTTLILYLLGIDSDFIYRDSNKTVYELLRGSSKYGNSSTSTAILYEQSIDENFYIEDVVAETSDKVIELIDNIRKAVEENNFKKEMIHISIPKGAFFSELRESVSNIRYLDMPGIDSKNLKEISHVDSIYKQFLSLATTVLVVCDSNKIQSLSTLAEKSRKKLSPHWELLNRYIIITVKSFSAASIYEEFFTKVHEKNQFYDFIKNKYNSLIHNKELLPDCKSNIYSFDLGTSVESLRVKLSLEDYDEVIETNKKMALELRNEIQEHKGNLLSGIVKELKIIVEDDIQEELNYITSEIEKYKKIITRETYQKEKRDDNRENKMNTQIEELKNKINSLTKLNSNMNISFVRDLFCSYKLDDLNKKLTKYKSQLEDYFSHPILHSEKKMILEIRETFSKITDYIKNHISINNEEKVEFSSIDFLDEQKLKLEFTKLSRPEIDVSKFSKKTRYEYLKAFIQQAENFENQYLILMMEVLKKYVTEEKENLEFQKKILESDDLKLKNFSINQQNIIDEYTDTINTLEQSKEKLMSRRTEIITYLDNYKKIGKEVFASCKEQLINEINNCEEKNRKMFLLLYLGIKEKEFQKFIQEC